MLVVSSDKDLYQLINDKIKILHPKNYEIYDANKIFEILGVFPPQIPDFLALVGDTSDGIPGVSGIGEKTAAKLLGQFKNLNDIYENLENIESARLKTSLTTCKEIAFTSKKLAELHASIPVSIDIEQLKFKESDKSELMDLCKELKFYSLMDKFISSKTDKTLNYVVVTKKEDLIKLVKQLAQQKIISLWIEPLADSNLNKQILGISIAAAGNHTVYIPISHSYIGAPAQLSLNEVIELIQVLLMDTRITKVIHDFKSFLKFLKLNDADIKYPIIDLMLLSYLLNPTKYNHSLDETAKEYMLYSILKKDDLSKEGNKKILLASVDINKFAEYASERTDVSLKLFDILFSKLKENNLFELYDKIELPLSIVLADMELIGAKIDSVLLKELSQDLKVKLDSLSENIYSLAGEIFNINSPKQLSEILFKKLKLPASKKTKITRQLSTGTEVLEELAAEYELAGLLLDYRQSFKLKNTYLDVLPQMIEPSTGRIHTIFNQAATATGRLSSSNPNLQNIPIRSPLGKKIREAFIADKDHLLLSADYSQIELRILAHLSGDENLIKAFHDNLDIHTLTASKIFNVPAGEVAPELRARAKIINFGIIYGLSAFGLSKQIGSTPEEAHIIINAYFRKYPKVDGYIKSLLEKVYKDGYVETFFSRKRYISQVTSQKSQPTTAPERAAVNMPVQGTAADIIKLAMINLHNELAKQNLKSKIILQIHDELLLEAPLDEVDHVKSLTKHVMETVVDFKVPLVVEIGIGKNWAEAH